MKIPSRIILIVACSILVALLGLIFIRNLIDFPVYYAAGSSLLSGRTDLYAPDYALGRVMDYRYPPFFLVALAPLWRAPYELAAYIWYLLSALEIAGCLVIVNRVFPVLRSSRKAWILLSLAALQYFVMALHYGNAHLLATFLLFSALYCLLQRKDVVGGLLIALAISIKVTPVLLLPYLALKKQWKMLGAICVFVVAINLLPAAYFGIRVNNNLLANWYGHVVASQEFHEDNGPINLSLKGQLRRYFSLVDYSKRVDGDTGYPAVNLAAESRNALATVWVVIAGVLFAAVLFLMWRGPRGSDIDVKESDLERAEVTAHELSVMICLMLLVGPLTSKIYFIALLWPLASLASIAVGCKAREARMAMLVLCVVAIINVALPLLPGRSTQRLLLVLGVDFYLNCLVMAVLLLAQVSRGRAIRGRSGEPRIPALSQAKTS
ncbi:MAG TPA: glycosyltransferase family 87 protein [Blastocatellia bacterium]|nr:glycosyltransferase family 87 protein [Blastocatellia bacterium]